MTNCPDCYPEIKYQCMKHRPENQCIGCLRIDQQLHTTSIGFLCKDCCRKQGFIFV